MTLTKFFEHPKLFNGFFTDTQKTEETFNKLKSLFYEEDIEVAKHLGDIKLATVLWLGRNLENRRNQTKNNVEELLISITQTQISGVSIKQQYDVDHTEHTKTTHNTTRLDTETPIFDVTTENTSSIPTGNKTHKNHKQSHHQIIEDLDKDGDINMADSKNKRNDKGDKDVTVPDNSVHSPQNGEDENSNNSVMENATEHDNMEEIMYSVPQINTGTLINLSESDTLQTCFAPSSSSLLELKYLDEMWLIQNNKEKNTFYVKEEEGMSQDLAQMQIDNQKDEHNTVNSDFFTKPKHSFLPNFFQLCEDANQENLVIELTKSGQHYTRKKEIAHPKSLLQKIKERDNQISKVDKDEDHYNQSIHAIKSPFEEETYDAFIDVNLIDQYHKIEDKLAYIELLVRDYRGFKGVTYDKENARIIVQNKKYAGMHTMATSFNQRHNQTFMKLIPTKYYTIKGQRISSKEFKILDVPRDITKAQIEMALRRILNGGQFYIRNTNFKADKVHKLNNIFITIKEEKDRHRLKNIWSIEIAERIYRICPAHFNTQDLEVRKKYRAEFTGFDSTHLETKALEVTNTYNPKNAFKQSDDKIIVEFEKESDLFNACEKTYYFGKYKIQGTPRGYPCWNKAKGERKKSLKIEHVAQNLGNKSKAFQAKFKGFFDNDTPEYAFDVLNMHGPTFVSKIQNTKEFLVDFSRLEDLHKATARPIYAGERKIIGIPVALHWDEYEQYVDSVKRHTKHIVDIRKDTNPVAITAKSAPKLHRTPATGANKLPLGSRKEKRISIREDNSQSEKDASRPPDIPRRL